MLTAQGGAYPGTTTGFYGYGWDGYGYVQNGAGDWFPNRLVAQITQLGYPADISGGVHQIRTDSVSFYYTASGAGTTNGQLLKQQTDGSAQSGGSSGGPWLINFGTAPTYGGPTSPGTANGQVVVGTTSWGLTDPNAKRQGASWFGMNVEFPAANYGGRGGGNIGALVNFICSNVNYAAAC